MNEADFIEYLGKEEYETIKGTRMEDLRREEYACYLDFLTNA